MAIRTSYSQTSTYIKCPMHWKWKYVDKLDAEAEGASLHFGTAVDVAVMAMLEGKDDYLVRFSDRWYSTKNRGGEYYQVYDNSNIMFGYADFDEFVFTPEDKAQISTWITELGIPYNAANPIESVKMIISKKKNKYTRISTPELRLFNRCSWLSMRRKGEILLELFKKDFVPKIKKVLATQKYYFLKDESTGDMLMGTLDFVAELEGYDKPVILDLKTAGRPYTMENIELSQQLPIYLALSENKFNTDLVGYVVLVKNINKKRVAVCTSCGSKKNGLHKTCNVLIGKTRCHGAWLEDVELNPQLQVIIEKKTRDEVNQVLIDYGEIVEAMKQKIVYKDVSQCHNWFGSKCPYFDACHKNDLGSLKKRY